MKYNQFIFESYEFNYERGELVLEYSYDSERKYREIATFRLPEDQSAINQELIDRLSFYTFIVAGSSYYKSFVVPEFVLPRPLSAQEAELFNLIYHGGLSQFVYENQLSPNNLATFAGTKQSVEPIGYAGEGILLMQSGGKDSLLSAELLIENNHAFTSWHMSSTGKYPHVLDEVGAEVVVSTRHIDIDAIKHDHADGGLNGHVPFSAIYAGYALIQAALLGKQYVLASNESSADQANVVVDGYEVNHQFTKTYAVELAIQKYLESEVTNGLTYASLLRPFNEIQVAELFAEKAWPKYRSQYSSCNVANYKQGSDDGNLSWCGQCPKCANTFVLLAPFVPKAELLKLFSGKNLLQDPDLTETYRQLFGLSDVKPFECVGTFEELQEAYAMATSVDSIFRNPSIDAQSGSSELHKPLNTRQPLVDDLLSHSALQR